MVKAPINNIIPFSNVDGPGNRTTIFFQACPFSCLYCHNPETIKLCVHCGACVDVCPTKALKFVDKKVVWDEQRCIDCDACINRCPHLSTPKIKYQSVAEVVAFIKQHQKFIEGITVSGGECMMYADFILALFKEVKALGLSCLIDSNGAYDFREYEALLACSDGVMLDVKAADRAFHQEICHYDNDMVLQNLHYLKEQNKLEEVRTVLLPNEDEQNCRTVSYVAQALQDQTRYKLLRYRPFGVRKEGIAYFGNMTISLEDAKKYEQLAHEAGHQHIIIV